MRWPTRRPLCAASGAFITQCIEQEVDVAHAMVLATAALKIKALAVDAEWRGQGITTAMLSTCADLYDRLGYHLVYGSFAIGSGLERYYASRGFEIVAAGRGIDVSLLLGRRAAMGAGPGERFFARWR